MFLKRIIQKKITTLKISLLYLKRVINIYFNKKNENFDDALKC